MSEPRYLLDTDVLSQPARRGCPQLLLERLEAHEGQLVTSSISIGEMVFGARNIAGGQRYLEYLERVVLPRIPVLPVDLQAARVYGEIRATLQSAGLRLADLDLLIASVALVHNATLVTGNLRHMQRVPGLEVVDWLRG
ncbi:MAG: type II toxin-antitoxin system VapC family toxin [bacterium]